MSGGPWMRRGGLPRPGERFPIFVPDLYPDCPRELESLRNASAPDNRDEQRRIADDPSSTLEQLVSVIDSYPARVHANPAWQLAVVTNVGLFAALRQSQLRALLRCGDADPGAIIAYARKIARFEGQKPEFERIIVDRADAPRRALELLVNACGGMGENAKPTRGPIAIARLRLRDPESTLTHWREGLKQIPARDRGRVFDKRLSAVTHVGTPVRELRKLATDRHWVIRGAALERMGVVR